ncbi:MAG: hypothetical protein J6N77_03250, partial [Lachnospiraceae bacterium]|nr:hypothetical protein [Lachnospiraceae bacterium]
MAIGVVVVFITTYALILPAISLDKDTSATDPAIVMEENKQEEFQTETATETKTELQVDVEPETEPPAAAPTVEVETEKATEAPEATAAPMTAENEKSAEENKNTEEDSGKTGKETVVTSESTAVFENEPEKPQAGEKTFTGRDFTLTVKYDENAGLTASAKLGVTELIAEEHEDSEDSENPEDLEKYEYINKEYFDGYMDGTLAAIRKNVDEKAELSGVRFFNIYFMQDGQAVTPEGTVEVTIEYKKPVEIDSDVTIKAVHFDATKEEPVVLSVEVTGKKGKDEAKDTVEKIVFDTSRPSFYAITYATLKDETAVVEETAAATESEDTQEAQETQAESELSADETETENDKTVFVREDEDSENAEEGTEADAASDPASEEQDQTDEVNMPAAKFVDLGSNVIVNVEAEEGTFPEGTTMEVTPVDAGDVESAAENVIDGKIQKVEAVDITFRNADGEPIQPAKPIRVTMLPKTIKSAEDATVVHVDEDGNADVVEAQAEGAKLQFEAEKFSVYAIVYTVDFEYEVNGKMYQFSLPGGGFVSFTDLVEVLGILDDTKNDGNKEEKQ